MTEQQAKLLTIVRNAKNPQQATEIAIKIIVACLNETKGAKENA